MSFGGRLHTCTTHFEFSSSGDESGNIEIVEDFIKYIAEVQKVSASKNSDSENT